MKIRNKKIILAFILMGVLVLLAGCYDLEGGLIFNEEGEAEVLVAVNADEIMGGEEARIMAWQIGFLFPEIDLNYDRTMETTRINYQDYLRIEFVRDGMINLSDSNYFNFVEEDGSYEFEAVIPPVIDDPSEETKDDIVLTFFFEMPTDIDMANTTEVDANLATWKLTKENLTTETSLRIITE